MRRIRAPFYEERQRALPVVRQHERLPTEDAAVRSRPGTGPRTLRGDSGFVQSLRKGFNITGMHSPTDETWSRQFLERGKLRGCERLHGVLLRIGCDDFEITPFAEREQRISSTSPGMNSADRSPHAGALLDKSNTGIEITAAEENVIQQSGNLFR